MVNIQHIHLQATCRLLQLQQKYSTAEIVQLTAEKALVIQNEVRNVQYLLNTINSNITQLQFIIYKQQLNIQQKINEQMYWRQIERHKDMFFCIDSECIKIY
ncbi:Hypothetical_protein [Hexamita inflata]|uniref:Hypothetical_protein n=1 Tax=Hexamita inflata TaxID=28002 RepID=A0AA86PDE1_9EUKA|nr:Hypothetical protein HINF_LOCUS24193 [Hexamita inflata]